MRTRSSKRRVAVALGTALVAGLLLGFAPADASASNAKGGKPHWVPSQHNGKPDWVPPGRGGNRGDKAPRYVVDASWPKPLPDAWLIGQVGGIAVDRHDNIWIIQRQRSLTNDEAWATDAIAARCDDGELIALGDTCMDASEPVPIDGLGNPRPNGPQATCCVPAPAVLQFDRDGNLLRAWGGPADPGFIGPHAVGEPGCDPAEGCQWPAGEHGIYVDHNDFVYIVGDLVYVCDRVNNRIQVFDKYAAGLPCSNSGQMAGVCGFVAEQFVAVDTLGNGSTWDLDTSPDRKQSCLFNPDGTNQKVWILERDSLNVLASFGEGGRSAGQFHWVHNLATDSHGTIYTAEVDTGKRAQKFVRRGPKGCKD